MAHAVVPAAAGLVPVTVPVVAVIPAADSPLQSGMLPVLKTPPLLPHSDVPSAKGYPLLLRSEVQASVLIPEGRSTSEGVALDLPSRVVAVGGDVSLAGLDEDIPFGKPLPVGAQSEAAFSKEGTAVESLGFRGRRLGGIERRVRELLHAFKAKSVGNLDIEDVSREVLSRQSLLSSTGSGGKHFSEPRRLRYADEQIKSDDETVHSKPTQPLQTTRQYSAQSPSIQPSIGIGKPAKDILASSASLWVAGTVLECLGPVLAQKLAGDFSVAGIVFVVGSFCGQMLAARLIGRFGLRRTYGSALLLGAAAGGGILLSYMASSLSLFLGSYALYSVAHGLWWNANEVAAPHVIGHDRAKLESFWGWDSLVCDVIGAVLSMATGLFAVAEGFLPALSVVPAAFLLSWILAAKGFRLLGEDERPHFADDAVQESLLSVLRRGAKIVFSNPALRSVLWACAGYAVLSPLIYKMLAPAFAFFLMGAADSAGVAAVEGLITGFYGLGGMLSGAWLIWQGRLLDRYRPADPKEAVNWEKRKLKLSLLRWMTFNVVGLSAVALMALPLPVCSTLFSFVPALPWLKYLTIPALAMLPLGMVQNCALLKLRSRFQSIVSDPEDRSVAIGFLEIVTMGMSAAALLAARLIFGLFSGGSGFAVFSFALIPLALYWLHLRSKVASSRSSPLPSAPGVGILSSSPRA